MSGQGRDAAIKVEANTAKRVVVLRFPDGSRAELSPADSASLRRMLEQAENVAAGLA